VFFIKSRNSTFLAKPFFKPRKQTFLDASSVEISHLCAHQLSFYRSLVRQKDGCRYYSEIISRFLSSKGHILLEILRFTNIRYSEPFFLHFFHTLPNASYTANCSLLTANASLAFAGGRTAATESEIGRFLRRPQTQNSYGLKLSRSHLPPCGFFIFGDRKAAVAVRRP